MQSLKKYFILLFIFCTNFSLYAQRTAVALEKMNVFYIGVENPLTVAAENCSCAQLVVKATNGRLTRKGCNFIIRVTEPGKSAIIIYKRTGNKLKELDTWEYRVKMVPDPIFKIGYYGPCRDKITTNHIKEQKFVRAELENFDFLGNFKVDSFRVTISNDSSLTKTYLNISNKISDELHAAFLALQKNDKIVFDKILVTGPDKIQREIAPLVLYVENTLEKFVESSNKGLSCW
ncbi:GldM family protein [Ferruginibacter sp. SUN002]|uniref:GldM family protein n=1 Tax=Ferruginibacter sp. SUN002 TaxID=2937789 RepID=UPI003D362773